MTSETYITEFKEEHVDQAAGVLTRSFLEMNAIWKEYKPKFEEIFPIMRGKILPAIASGWSFVLMRGHTVIGVSIEYELLDYIKMPSMPSKLDLFRSLGEAGKRLEAKVDFSELQRGEAIYGLYGVIDPSEANKGHSLLFWWHLFAMGKIGGWKYYYSRISSPVSLKMLLKLGAEVLAEVDCDNEKMWMIRIDLRRPFPSYSMIKEMTKPKAPKAKL